MRFKVHKGDQEQIESVRVRTRTEVRDSKSSFREDGGTVALMLELISCSPSLLDDAPPLLVPLWQIHNSNTAVLVEQ